MKRIEIARDFSEFPGGRTPEDGPFSGQEFCEKYLLPAMREKEQTEIILDGTRGYASSFLEESFGGLVRHGYTREMISEKLIILASSAFLLGEIAMYIRKAENRVKFVSESAQRKAGGS